VIRISGPSAAEMCRSISGKEPISDSILRSSFRDEGGELLDMGLVLFFAGPRSFTGEDVCEFQIHGSPVVVDQLLSCLLRLGCRLARPGEFSERAFLNNKIDLTQAEAIADLIDSSSARAARMALRSLQGEFSRRIDALVTKVTGLRIYVEAAIDFPEEEVDFLQAGEVFSQLQALEKDLDILLQQAKQGSLIREGIRVVLAGEPNAGKSTLMNTLSGNDTAIVTDIPGTTRDILRQELLIEGMPVHLADTAGLHDSTDPVECEGMRRARSAMQEADRVLLLVDARKLDSLHREPLWQELSKDLHYASKLTLLLTKSDLLTSTSVCPDTGAIPSIRISAKTGLGMQELRQHLVQCAGQSNAEEGGFIARRRHLEALLRAQGLLANAHQQLMDARAGELVADDLRLVQSTLGEITGAVSADDLLGAIFSSFCIGK
jgi:tRNA modification GTPase